MSTIAMSPLLNVAPLAAICEVPPFGCIDQPWFGTLWRLLTKNVCFLVVNVGLGLAFEEQPAILNFGKAN
jgi:hypothetical protein